MLPGPELGIVDAFRRLIALAQVEAFVVHDVVPDLVRDLGGIEDGRDPDDAEHGAAESDAARIVPARPGEPGVLDILGMEQTRIEQSVDGIRDERMLPHVSSEKIPAPPYEDGAAGDDEIIGGDEIYERVRLPPIQFQCTTDDHLAEVLQDVVRSSLQIIGDMDGRYAGTDGPSIVEVLLRNEFGTDEVHVVLAAGRQQIGQIAFHSSSPLRYPSGAGVLTSHAPRTRGRHRYRNRTTTWRWSRWTAWE